MIVGRVGLNQQIHYLPSVSDVSSALSPKTWPFSLEWLPHSACLVGGTVRDALLGRQGEYLDLDFVLPEGAVATAQAIARHYRAGYVLLDAERQIARVVFEQGTADFALQVGSTLEADLKRRDFTVNAIAYNPHTDQIIDPLHGYADLQKRMLRMVSAENLEEDPLRLLRAFRQAAQLGFTVEDTTRVTIRQFAPLLRHIAAERVQSEINYLLGSARGTTWLLAAWQDGLLNDWFPNTNRHNLDLVAAIDEVAVTLKETIPAFEKELSSRVRNNPRTTRHKASPGVPETPQTAAIADAKAPGSNRTWLAAAKLAGLVLGNPVAAEGQLRRLKYSRTEIQAVSTMLKFLPLLNIPVGDSSATVVADSLLKTAPLRLSLRQQYHLFQGVGITFPAVAVLAIAAGTPMAVIVPLIDRFLDPSDPVAHPTPLLSGQDLMATLQLPAGPQIGQLLAAIQLARAEGTILTTHDALELAAQLLDGGDRSAIESATKF